MGVGGQVKGSEEKEYKTQAMEISEWYRAQEVKEEGRGGRK